MMAADTKLKWASTCLWPSNNFYPKHEDSLGATWRSPGSDGKAMGMYDLRWPEQKRATSASRHPVPDDA
jgi:hypothetical protein